MHMTDNTHHMHALGVSSTSSWRGLLNVMQTTGALVHVWSDNLITQQAVVLGAHRKKCNFLAAAELALLYMQ